MKIRSSFAPLLSPSPLSKLYDPEGTPQGVTGEENLAGKTFDDRLRDLGSPIPAVRGLALGGLIEHTRPDDVLARVPAMRIVEDWPLAERFVHRRLDLWKRIVRRLGWLAEASFDPELAFPADERARKPSRATRDLASALLEIVRNGKGSSLLMVWSAQSRGATLRGAMLHIREEAASFSFLELVAALMTLDLESTARLYEKLIDETTLERWQEDRGELADQMLDLVVAPLVVRH